MAIITKIKKYYQQYGCKVLLLKLFRNHPNKEFDYMQWYEHNKASDETLKSQRNRTWEKAPLISVVVPAYLPKEKFFVELIEAMQGQTYANWELCIADGSPDESVAAIIEKYQDDQRIKYQKLTENLGIADNTNAALRMASGDYIGLLDHDDYLEPDALYEVVSSILENRADIIYTDEDKVNADGTRFFEPNFKPDFNLTLLRSNNYICHFFVVKRAIVEQIDGFRKAFDGAQDYDFIFRCIETSDAIAHVAKPLYHWRIHDDSTAARPESKLYAYVSGEKAIAEHLKRMGETGSVKRKMDLGFYHVNYQMKENEDLTILIQKRGSSDALVKKCKKAIQKSIIDHKDSKNLNVEIVVVEKFSDMRLDEIKGAYVALVDASVTIKKKGWNESLLAICQRDAVGAVGIKLFERNDTIYHAGIIKGQKQYAFYGLPREVCGYMHREDLMQELAGVTTDFMMLSKALLSQNMQENPGQIDDELSFCEWINAQGKKIIYEPDVWGYTQKKGN